MSELSESDQRLPSCQILRQQTHDGNKVRFFQNEPSMRERTAGLTFNNAVSDGDFRADCNTTGQH